MKIAKLSYVLNMDAVEFEFKDAVQANNFAKLLQAATVACMHKALNLQKESELDNPQVPGFSLVGVNMDNPEFGFDMGRIEAIAPVKRKYNKRVTNDPTDPANDTSEDETNDLIESIQEDDHDSSENHAENDENTEDVELIPEVAKPNPKRKK